MSHPRFVDALLSALLIAAATAPVAAQQPRRAVPAAAAKPVAPAKVAPVSQIPDYGTINAWTLGLAAGRTEGAPLRFAAELARELDDGHQMRVLPIVTRGPFDNVFDLLHLRGVDLAVVSGDILDFIKKDPAGPFIARKIAYVMQLVPAEVHILARPEINSLKDLEGKAVNFNSQGTQAAYTGPILFDRLGIKVDKQFVPHAQAMAEMMKGDKFAATFWVSSKPLDPLAKRTYPAGFKLLPVEPTPALLEYYFPTVLEAADYPNLIPAGGRVDTVAVPTVLAAFNWTRDPDRQRRIGRFVEYLFARLPNLQSKPGYDAKWKDINLAAEVPGWQRLPAMQVKLDALAAAAKAGDTAKPTPPPSGTLPAPAAPGRRAEGAPKAATR